MLQVAAGLAVGGVKTMSNIATTSTHNHTHCVTTDSMSKASTISVSVRPGSRESVGRFLFTKSKQNKTSHCMPRLTRDGSGIHGNVECMHSIDTVFRSVS